MRAATILIALSAAALAGTALAQDAPVPTRPAPPEAVGADPEAIRELPTRGGPIADAGDARGRGPRGAPRGQQVFFSPAGEPFRAPRGEPYPVAAWFARANTSHDGKLTRAQFLADAEAFFAKLDTNHDGMIDGFENQDYEQKVAPEILPRIGRLNAEDAGYGSDAPGVGRQAGSPHRRRGGGGGGGGGERPRKGVVNFEGAAPYSLLNEPQPIQGADFAFDGHITLAEFRRATNERFDLLDTKHLGYLTLATLPKTPLQQLAEQAEAERRKHDKGHAPTAPASN